MKESLLVLILAFLLDLLLGDPVYRLHPVRLMGRLITGIETRLERWGCFGVSGGVLVLILVLLAVLGVYLLLAFLISGAGLLLLNIFILYSCISIQDLIKHGKAVLSALELYDLEQARQAVQMLIGRDAAFLDSFGVARAGVESLAENFVDGFLAPLFWFAAGCLLAGQAGLPAVIGGVTLALAYRAVNTLDSMVGYKNERYQAFGKASAVLDDGLNFIPARLSIPILSLAAGLCRLDVKKAWLVAWRDRLHHSSPNAGHSEACVAGALRVRLNGPGIYPHGRVDKPWLGDGTADVTSWHLKQAIRLVFCAAVCTTLLLALLLLALQ